MKQPTVTIGFLPRERFNLAAKALRAIYKHTHIPFRLIVIDCNTPSRYLNQMKNVLEGKENVTIIHTDNYLQPNQSRNLVLANTNDDYVAFIENDCFVSDNWLSKLITACEEFPAGVAIPLLLEGMTVRRKVHHDTKLAKIRTWQDNGKTFYEFKEDLSLLKRYGSKARERVWSIEMHIMLFQRKVFDVIGPFDETLNTREPVDISLALYKANVPIVFEPAAQVNFYHPPPVYNDELPFYYFVWDLEHCIKSNKYLAEKWNIVNMADSTEFVKDQHYRTTYWKWLMRKVPKKIAKMFKLSK